MRSHYVRAILMSGLVWGVLLGVPLSAQAIVFHFDYSTDSTGFFGEGNPQGALAGEQARAALEAAGAFFEDVLGDDLAAIQPFGFNRWNAVYTHPATGEQASTYNLSVPEDTIWVYVGARALEGSTLAEAGPGGYSGLWGSPTFRQAVTNRGQGDPGTDFAPWGGAMAFDIDANWHFDHTTAPAGGKFDLYSVALHELGHVLGFGLAKSWEGYVQNHLFSGPEAVSVYGANVPLSSDDGHWQSGLSDTIFRTTLAQETAMDPNIGPRTRKYYTDLDVAALDDIGWEITPPATLTWNGPTGTWGSANWLSGLQFVSPQGRENMVVEAGTVTVDQPYTGVMGALSLSINGGRVDLPVGANLDVFGPVSVGSGGRLDVAGVLSADTVSVSGPGLAGGLLSGTGTIAGDVTVFGAIAPGGLSELLWGGTGLNGTAASVLSQTSSSSETEQFSSGPFAQAGPFAGEDVAVLPRVAAAQAEPDLAQSNAVVPEPGSMGVLVGALLLLWPLLRRRR